MAGAFTCAAAFVPGAAAAPPAQSSPAATAVDPALMASGKTVYHEYCISCHRIDGQGVPGAFPQLAGNQKLADAKFVVQVLKRGRSGEVTVSGHQYDNTMPPIGSALTNKQLAAVTTYIRNSWGNHFGGTSTDDVRKILASP